MLRLPDRLHNQIDQLAERHSDAMVTVIDESETIRYASGTALRLFGYLPAEIVGHKLDEFFGPLDVATLRLALADALLNGESVRVTRQVQLKFGGTKCMNGPAYGFVDSITRQPYAVAIAHPCGR